MSFWGQMKFCLDELFRQVKVEMCIMSQMWKLRYRISNNSKDYECRMYDFINRKPISEFY